jgi:nitroreductase
MQKKPAQKLLETIFNRKSIRKFRSKVVPEEHIQKIVEAGQRAPSACNLQTYSIIWVKDEKIKEKILDVCGASGMKNVPVVFAICADFRRLHKTLDYLNADHCLNQKEGYAIKLMSIIDPSNEEIKKFLDCMDGALEKEGYYQKYSNQKPGFRYSNHIQRKTAKKTMQKLDVEIKLILEKQAFA